MLFVAVIMPSVILDAMNKLNRIQREVNLLHQLRMDNILRMYGIPSYFFKHKKARGKLFVKPIKNDKK